MLVVLLVIFTTILFYSFRQEQNDITKTTPETHIRGYEILYTDQKGDFDKTKVIVSQMIVSDKYALRGKPDYIYINKSKTDLIPVELKSGKIKDNEMPYAGDLMQLVAYFLMIEDKFTIKPREGRIIYKDHMFIIKNTKKLRTDLLKIIDDMNNMLETGESNVSPSFIKCKHCICNATVCEFKK